MCVPPKMDLAVECFHVARIVAKRFARGAYAQDVDEMEQVAAEGLVRARHRHDPSRGSAPALAASVCRNAILTWRRQRRPETPTDLWESRISGGREAEPEVIQAAKRAAVLAAVGQLSPRYAEFIRLKFGLLGEPKKYTEICQMLSMPEGTAKSVWWYALKKLAPKLREWV